MTIKLVYGFHQKNHLCEQAVSQDTWQNEEGSRMETPMTLRVASTTKLYMRWATYRAEADECRRMATKALDPVDRERWLRVAEQWLDLIPRPLNGCERNQGIDSARNRQAGQ
jgi:hypothetical protein